MTVPIMKETRAKILGYKFLVGYCVQDEIIVLAGSDKEEYAKEYARYWSKTMKGTDIHVYPGSDAQSLFPSPIYTARAPSDHGVPLPRPQNNPGPGPVTNGGGGGAAGMAMHRIQQVIIGPHSADPVQRQHARNVLFDRWMNGEDV